MFNPAAIVASFAASPSGPFHAATVANARPLSRDAGGSIITGTTPTVRDCRAQVDSVTDAMRREEGYQTKDVRLIIVSLVGALEQGERVTVKGATYRVESITSDPLAIGFDCRARPA